LSQAEFDKTGHVVPVVVIEDVGPIMAQVSRFPISEGCLNLVTEFLQENATRFPIAVTPGHHVLDNLVCVVVSLGPPIVVLVATEYVRPIYRLVQLGVPEFL
jgi:hypothetical protein